MVKCAVISLGAFLVFFSDKDMVIVTESSSNPRNPNVILSFLLGTRKMSAVSMWPGMFVCTGQKSFRIASHLPNRRSQYDLVLVNETLKLLKLW